MKKRMKLTAFVLAVVTVMTMFSLNGFALATELEAGDSKANATAIPEFGVEYVSTITVPSEEDWFKFTTLSEDAYYTFTMKLYSLPGDSYGPYYYLYDSNMQEISGVRNDSTVNKKLEKDSTYYIKVCNRPDNGKYDSGDIGTYEIKVSYKKDVTPNSMSNASQIEINKSYVFSMDGWGDYDYFKFTAPVAAEYTVAAENYDINTDGYMLNIVLLDSNSKTIASCKCSKTESKSFVADLEAGEVYYIQVYMGSHKWKETGNYEISVNCDELISEPELTGINVLSAPDKTTYKVGEELDITGIVVIASYSDGSTNLAAGCDYSGFDSSMEGTKTVTVSYTENGITKTDYFEVTVEAETDTDGFNWLAIFNVIANIFGAILNAILAVIFVFTGE